MSERIADYERDDDGSFRADFTLSLTYQPSVDGAVDYLIGQAVTCDLCGHKANLRHGLSVWDYAAKHAAKHQPYPVSNGRFE